MSNINKQALIAKIKKQAESFDTVVLREDEANALLDELEVAEKRIEELESALNRHYELPDVYDMAIKQFESLSNHKHHFINGTCVECLAKSE